MTQSSYNKFIDRRTEEQVMSGLATPILYWYDLDKKKRHRTNGITITTDGMMIVGRSVCSKGDQFNRSIGRLKTTSRILGRAQKHCWIIIGNPELNPDAFALEYLNVFPGDDRGCRRAYNAAKIFHSWKKELKRLEQEQLDA
jgi:hypothetical protein